MAIDEDKIDDYTLALMYLVTFDEKFAPRAWKSFDWETMERLCEKGFISNPIGKAKSVVVTPEGEEKMKKLFKQFFTDENNE